MDVFLGANRRSPAESALPSHEYFLENWPANPADPVLRPPGNAIHRISSAGTRTVRVIVDQMQAH